MSGLGSSCGACKFLRRKCTNECVFAPYFYYDQAANHFAAVHKVFGASNVSKLLSHLPVHHRSEAAITVSYEALARMHDPIYGCVAHIFALQQQVASLQEEIESLGNQLMANLKPYMSNYAATSQLTNPPSNCGLQFSCPDNDLNINSYLNQELSHTEYTAENQAFYNQMNVINLPILNELEEDPSFGFFLDPNLSRELPFEGEIIQCIESRDDTVTLVNQMWAEMTSESKYHDPNTLRTEMEKIGTHLLPMPLVCAVSSLANFSF